MKDPLIQSRDDQLALFQQPPARASYRDPPPLQSVSIYRVTLVRESSLPIHDQRLRNSADSESLIRTYLQGVDREHFIVLLVNRKNEVTGINPVSMGSLTASIVSPSKVFTPAMLGNAAAIICAHNHPSGDPKPSAEDRALTARLYDAGKLLDIQVLDHIIIGDGTTAYYSFADNGTLTG